MKENNPKKCLLVNPVLNGGILTRFFTQKGVRCSALIDVCNLTKTKGLGSKQKNQFDSTCYDRVYTSVERLVREQPTFDAIIAGSEIGVETTEYLCQRLSCRGNHPNTTRFRRDKEWMHHQLRKLDLASIRTFRVNSQEEIPLITSQLEEGHYIVKPADAAGGDEVVFCPNLSCVSHALEHAKWGDYNAAMKQNGSYLVQNYIDGPEYAINLVVRHNEIIVSSLVRYHKSECDRQKLVRTHNTLLSPCDLQFASLIAYAKKAVRALDVTMGPVHMELIYGQHGPVMVELGARLHGGIMPLLFQVCYEPDLMTSIYQCYFEPDRPLEEATLRQAGEQIFILARKPGVFQGLDQQDRSTYKEIQSLITYEILVDPGDAYPETTNLITCPAAACFANSDHRTLEKDKMAFKTIMERYF